MRSRDITGIIGGTGVDLVLHRNTSQTSIQTKRRNVITVGTSDRRRREKKRRQERKLPQRTK